MKFLLYISTAIFLFFMSFATCAADTDNRTPLDRYKGNSDYVMMICRISFYNSQTNDMLGKMQDEDSNYVDCIERGRNSTRVNLESAIKVIQKPKAIEALKSYHVAMVTALQGIRPGIEERKQFYQQRQQALEQKVTEAWEKFEIER